MTVVISVRITLALYIYYIMRISLIVRHLAHDQKILVQILYPRTYLYPSAGMVDSTSLSFVG